MDQRPSVALERRRHGLHRLLCLPQVRRHRRVRLGADGLEPTQALAADDAACRAAAAAVAALGDQPVPVPKHAHLERLRPQHGVERREPRRPLPQLLLPAEVLQELLLVLVLLVLQLRLLLLEILLIDGGGRSSGGNGVDHHRRRSHQKSAQTVPTTTAANAAGAAHGNGTSAVVAVV